MRAGESFAKNAVAPNSAIFAISGGTGSGLLSIGGDIVWQTKAMQDASPEQAQKAFQLTVPEPRGVLLEELNVDYFYKKATMPKYMVDMTDDILLDPFSWLSFGARLKDTVLPEGKPYKVITCLHAHCNDRMAGKLACQ